jgi:predicted HicB family RNase H-like nuclease
MALKTVHIRLPVHVYRAAKEKADNYGVSLSEYVRGVVAVSLPARRRNRRNVAAERTAITYSADEGMPEQVSQAALQEGISINDFYVRALCRATETLPCHVVVVKEPQE